MAEEVKKKRRPPSEKSLKNLRPPLGRNPEEDRKIQSMGGKAARAKIMRQRKLTEIIGDIGALQAVTAFGKEIAEEYGIDTESEEAVQNFTNDLVLVVSMYKEAQNGNVEAAKWIRSTSGQDPVQSMQLTAGEISSANLKAIPDAELVEMANRLETEAKEEAKEQGELPDGGSPLLLPKGGNPDGSASEGN